jgi:hypothetical protein
LSWNSDTLGWGVQDNTEGEFSKMERRHLLVAAAPVLAAATLAATGTRAATIAKPQPTIFDFGAVGDGVTDDSAAFVRALTYSAANGVVVTVPGFTYAIANSIAVTLSGNVVKPWGLAGFGATLLSRINTGADVMLINSIGVVRYLQLSGFKIQGSGNDGNGLHLQCLGTTIYLYNVTIDGLSIEGAGKHDLLFEGNVFESGISNSYFQDAKQNGATFAQSKGGICSAITVVNCYFNQNGGSGLVCTNFDGQYGGTTDVRVYGGYCRENKQFGFYYNNGTNGGAIEQVGFENNCTQLSPGDPNGAHVYALSSIKMRDCTGFNMFGGATYLVRGWFSDICLLDGCSQAAGGAMAATGKSALIQVNGSNTGNVVIANSRGNIVCAGGNQCTWQATNCSGTSPSGTLSIRGMVASA